MRKSHIYFGIACVVVFAFLMANNKDLIEDEGLYRVSGKSTGVLLYTVFPAYGIYLLIERWQKKKAKRTLPS